MTTENEIRTRLLKIHDDKPLDKPWCEGYVTALMDWDIISEEVCDRLIDFIAHSETQVDDRSDEEKYYPPMREI